MSDWVLIEQTRLALQAERDGLKTPEDRNRLGQFATPTALAQDILRHGLSLLPENQSISFLDPGIGTGAFYSALQAVAGNRKIDAAKGFEVDSHYSEPAKRLWSGHALEIRETDFTSAVPSDEDDKANLLVCNPPYVRHHHMRREDKARILKETEAVCGIPFNGLSGLYCYFLGLSHRWMRPGCVAAWLIPSEFMDVNYGRQVKEYLLGKVTLLQIHRFAPEDVQFSDALVSSAIVWIKNQLPDQNHKVLFSYGGSQDTPDIQREMPANTLRHEPKWSRFPKSSDGLKRSNITLGDIFDVKRGLATGDNKFFIMTREQIEQRALPFEVFRPVLPSSRYIPENEIHADSNGVPLLEKQTFLLDTSLPEEQILEQYPKLFAYLQTGKEGEKPVSDRYLCKARKPWYSQENRPASPFVCTYMGRPKNGAKPFRFILNHSKATACNVFLMLYPKPDLARAFMRTPSLKRRVWEFLNSITTETLLDNGRVYGGGLHKMEPKELRRVDATELALAIPELNSLSTQTDLLTDLKRAD